jgi:diguanylate cyclase (GGDEF)-like protein/PAS domain S-box-containing protein
VILPVALLLVLAAAVIVGLMLFNARTQDEIARQASIDTMRTGIVERGRQLNRVVKDYAYWSEAAEAIQIRRDQAWAEERLGYYLHETHGYDWVFVIAPDDATFYAAYQGEQTDQIVSQALAGELWRALAARGRQTSLEEPEASYAFLPIPGGVGIASVAAITPEASWEGPRPAGERYLLLVVRQLTPELLAELARALKLSDLRFTGAEEQAATFLPLLGPDETVVGRIVWEPHRPGMAYLTSLAPSMVSAIVLFGLFAVSAFRQSRAATEAIVASESRFRDVADASSDWIFEADAQGRIGWVSDRFTALTGIATEEVDGLQLAELLAPMPDAVDDELAGALAQGRLFRDAPRVCRDREGRRRFLRVSGKPLVDAHGHHLGWRGTATDVTVEFEATRAAEFLSRHDPLTGCLNRNSLLDALSGAIETIVRRGERIGLFLFDIDGFKELNDAFGPTFGDHLLKELSARLEDAARPGDLIARLSADEFVLVRPSLPDAGEADRVAHALQRVLCDPFGFDGKDATFTASVAVVMLPEDADSAERALQLAGVVMSRAKSSGRGSVRSFEAGMDAALQERKELEHDLRRAIERGELEVYYQPKLDVKKGTLSGVEALVRWRHPTRGLVPPVQFIPIAEETGLIREIGAWVLRRACRDVAAWCDISVAVNLSPVQFEDDDLLQTIKSALTDAGLPPRRLELEITEGVLLANDERANNCLTAFGRLGVRLAMDDFGTGYSSMSYLTRFRFDKIKIDRAFVSALDRGGEAIIRAIIGMSRNLEIVTCAEGIETEEQLHALKRLGCDEIQGYGYGRPMSLDELKARFAPGRPLRVVSSAA